MATPIVPRTALRPPGQAAPPARRMAFGPPVFDLEEALNGGRQETREQRLRAEDRETERMALTAMRDRAKEEERRRAQAEQQRAEQEAEREKLRLGMVNDEVERQAFEIGRPTRTDAFGRKEILDEPERDRLARLERERAKQLVELEKARTAGLASAEADRRRSLDAMRFEAEAAKREMAKEDEGFKAIKDGLYDKYGMRDPDADDEWVTSRAPAEERKAYQDAKARRDAVAQRFQDLDDKAFQASDPRRALEPDAIKVAREAGEFERRQAEAAKRAQDFDARRAEIERSWMERKAALEAERLDLDYRPMTPDQRMAALADLDIRSVQTRAEEIRARDELDKEFAAIAAENDFLQGALGRVMGMAATVQQNADRTYRDPNTYRQSPARTPGSTAPEQTSGKPGAGDRPAPQEQAPEPIRPEIRQLAEEIRKKVRDPQEALSREIQSVFDGVREGAFTEDEGRERLAAIEKKAGEAAKRHQEIASETAEKTVDALARKDINRSEAAAIIDAVGVREPETFLDEVQKQIDAARDPKGRGGRIANLLKRQQELSVDINRITTRNVAPELAAMRKALQAEAEQITTRDELQQVLAEVSAAAPAFRTVEDQAWLGELLDKSVRSVENFMGDAGRMISAPFKGEKGRLMDDFYTGLRDIAQGGRERFWEVDTPEGVKRVPKIGNRGDAVKAFAEMGIKTDPKAIREARGEVYGINPLERMTKEGLGNDIANVVIDSAPYMVSMMGGPAGIGLGGASMGGRYLYEARQNTPGFAELPFAQQYTLAVGVGAMQAAIERMFWVFGKMPGIKGTIPALEAATVGKIKGFVGDVAARTGIAFAGEMVEEGAQEPFTPWVFETVARTLGVELGDQQTANQRFGRDWNSFVESVPEMAPGMAVLAMFGLPGLASNYTQSKQYAEELRRLAGAKGMDQLAGTLGVDPEAWQKAVAIPNPVTSLRAMERLVGKASPDSPKARDQRQRILEAATKAKLQDPGLAGNAKAQEFEATFAASRDPQALATATTAALREAGDAAAEVTPEQVSAALTLVPDVRAAVAEETTIIEGLEQAFAQNGADIHLEQRKNFIDRRTARAAQTIRDASVAAANFAAAEETAKQQRAEATQVGGDEGAALDQSAQIDLAEIAIAKAAVRIENGEAPDVVLAESGVVAAMATVQESLGLTVPPIRMEGDVPVVADAAIEMVGRIGGDEARALIRATESQRLRQVKKAQKDLSSGEDMGRQAPGVSGGTPGATAGNLAPGMVRWQAKTAKGGTVEADVEETATRADALKALRKAAGDEQIDPMSAAKLDMETGAPAPVAMPDVVSDAFPELAPLVKLFDAVEVTKLKDGTPMEVSGGTLRVDRETFLKNYGGRPDAARSVVTHELIHVAWNEAIADGKFTKADAIKVWNDLGKTREGRMLRKMVETAYFNAARNRGEAVSESAKMTDYQATAELVRMMVEDVEFAGRVNEVFAAPFVSKNKPILKKLLDAFADFLRRAVARVRDADPETANMLDAMVAATREAFAALEERVPSTGGTETEGALFAAPSSGTGMALRRANGFPFATVAAARAAKTKAEKAGTIAKGGTVASVLDPNGKVLGYEVWAQKEGVTPAELPMAVRGVKPKRAAKKKALGADLGEMLGKAKPGKLKVVDPSGGVQSEAQTSPSESTIVRIYRLVDEATTLFSKPMQQYSDKDVARTVQIREELESLRPLQIAHPKSGSADERRRKTFEAYTEKAQATDTEIMVAWHEANAIINDGASRWNFPQVMWNLSEQASPETLAAAKRFYRVMLGKFHPDAGGRGIDGSKEVFDSIREYLNAMGLRERVAEFQQKPTQPEQPDTVAKPAPSKAVSKAAADLRAASEAGRLKPDSVTNRLDRMGIDAVRGVAREILGREPESSDFAGLVGEIEGALGAGDALTLSGQTDEEIRNEQAKRRQREEIERRRSAKLQGSLQSGDTTPDMLDPLAGETPLFNQPPRRQPRQFRTQASPSARAFRNHPLIASIIDDHGGIRSKTSMRRSGGEKIRGEYDGAPKLPPAHSTLIYREGGLAIDELATALDMDVEDLWTQIDLISQSAVAASKEDAKREREEKQAEAQSLRFGQASAEGPVRVLGNELAMGDVVEIEGTKTRVVAVSEDGGVTLENGARFGLQDIEGDEAIYVEKVQRAPRGEGFMPPLSPEAIREAGFPDLADRVEQIEAEIGQERGTEFATEGDASVSRPILTTQEDVIRAKVAELAATAINSDPEERRAILALVEAHPRVRKDGVTGETVPFDPDRHFSDGGIAPGTPVVVEQAGYALELDALPNQLPQNRNRPGIQEGMAEMADGTRNVPVVKARVRVADRAFPDAPPRERSRRAERQARREMDDATASKLQREAGVQVGEASDEEAPIVAGVATSSRDGVRVDAETGEETPGTMRDTEPKVAKFKFGGWREDAAKIPAAIASNPKGITAWVRSEKPGRQARYEAGIARLAGLWLAADVDAREPFAAALRELGARQPQVGDRVRVSTSRHVGKALEQGESGAVFAPGWDAPVSSSPNVAARMAPVVKSVVTRDIVSGAVLRAAEVPLEDENNRDTLRYGQTQDERQEAGRVAARGDGSSGTNDPDARPAASVAGRLGAQAPRSNAKPAQIAEYLGVPLIAENHRAWLKRRGATRVGKGSEAVAYKGSNGRIYRVVRPGDVLRMRVRVLGKNAYQSGERSDAKAILERELIALTAPGFRAATPIAVTSDGNVILSSPDLVRPATSEERAEWIKSHRKHFAYQRVKVGGVDVIGSLFLRVGNRLFVVDDLHQDNFRVGEDGQVMVSDFYAAEVTQGMMTALGIDPDGVDALPDYLPSGGIDGTVAPEQELAMPEGDPITPSETLRAGAVPAAMARRFDVDEATDPMAHAYLNRRRGKIDTRTVKTRADLDRHAEEEFARRSANRFQVDAEDVRKLEPAIRKAAEKQVKYGLDEGPATLKLLDGGEVLEDGSIRDGWHIWVKGRVNSPRREAAEAWAAALGATVGDYYVEPGEWGYEVLSRSGRPTPGTFDSRREAQDAADAANRAVEAAGNLGITDPYAKNLAWDIIEHSIGARDNHGFGRPRELNPEALANTLEAIRNGATGDPLDIYDEEVAKLATRGLRTIKAGGGYRWVFVPGGQGNASKRRAVQNADIEKIADYIEEEGRAGFIENGRFYDQPEQSPFIKGGNVMKSDSFGDYELTPVAVIESSLEENWKTASHIVFFDDTVDGYWVWPTYGEQYWNFTTDLGEFFGGDPVEASTDSTSALMALSPSSWCTRGEDQARNYLSNVDYWLLLPPGKSQTIGGIRLHTGTNRMEGINGVNNAGDSRELLGDHAGRIAKLVREEGIEVTDAATKRAVERESDTLRAAEMMQTEPIVVSNDGMSPQGWPMRTRAGNEIIVRDVDPATRERWENAGALITDVPGGVRVSQGEAALVRETEVPGIGWVDRSIAGLLDAIRTAGGRTRFSHSASSADHTGKPWPGDSAYLSFAEEPPVGVVSALEQSGFRRDPNTLIWRLRSGDPKPPFWDAVTKKVKDAAETLRAGESPASVETEQQTAMDRLASLLNYLPAENHDAVLDVMALVRQRDPDMIGKATRIFDTIAPTVLYRAMRMSKNEPRINVVMSGLPAIPAPAPASAADDDYDYEPFTEDEFRALARDLTAAGQANPESPFAPGPQGSTLANVILGPLADTIGAPREPMGDVARQLGDALDGAFGGGDSILRAAEMVTPEMDAEYMAAVERGDMETAQRMVDEAARAAGYNVGPVFHGTPDGRFLRTDPVFRSEKARFGWGRDTGVHWFASSKRTADTYADDRRAFDYQNAEPATIRAFLRLQNPLTLNGGGAKWSDAQRRGRTTDAIQEALNGGHDGLVIENVQDDYQTGALGRTAPTTTYAAFRPEGIKSADPVTYDASGAVIPLSQRFDPASDSILRAAPLAAPKRGAGIEDAANRALVTAIEEAAKATKPTREGIAKIAAAAETQLRRVPGLAPFIEIIARAPDLFGRQFINHYGVKAEAAFLQDEARRQAAWKNTTAGEYMRLLNKGGTSQILGLHVPKKYANREMAEKVYRVVSGEMPLTALPEEIRVVAKSLRDDIDALSRQAVAEGILEPETVAKGIGEYVRRYYLHHEKERYGVRSIIAGLLSKSEERRAAGQNRMDRSYTKARLSDAFAVVDVSGKNPKPVPHTDGKWRFDDAASRDAWFADFRDRQTAKMARIKPSELNDPVYARQVDAARRAFDKRYKVRAPLTEDELTEKGLIRDARYVFPRMIVTMGHDIAMAKMFNQLSVDPDLVRDPVKGQDAPAGFRQMPINKALGALSGKLVEENLARDLWDLANAPSDAMRLYDALNSLWKESHTVWNPATHGRNLMGNMMFADLAGASPIGPDAGYFRNAWQILKDGKTHNGVDQAELAEQGILGSDFGSREFAEALARVERDEIEGSGRWWGFLPWLRQVAHAGYQMEDAIFKTAAYLKARDKGLTREQALAHVRRWFPFYDNVPNTPGTKMLKRTTMPFLSFYMEAIRIGANAARYQPITFAKWMAMPGLLTAFSLAALGMDEDDDEWWENYAQALQRDFGPALGAVLGIGGTPDQKAIIAEMRGRNKVGPIPLHFSILIPRFDSDGTPQQFDLTNTIPYANILGMRTEEGRDPQPWWMRWGRQQLSAPALAYPINLFMNVDPFSGRSWLKDGMTTDEEAWAALHLMRNTFLPTLFSDHGVVLKTADYLTGSDIGKSTMDKRTKAQDVFRSAVGVDIRSAQPQIWRIINRWKMDNGLPVRSSLPDMSTAQSRAGGEVYQAFLNQDVAELTKAIERYRRVNPKGLVTYSQFERLIKDRHPLDVNIEYWDIFMDRPGASPAAARAAREKVMREKGVSDISEVERQAIARVLREHQARVRQAPELWNAATGNTTPDAGFSLPTGN